MSVPVQQFRSAFPPAPPAASTCPKCGAPAAFGATARRCETCGLAFVLRGGALMDTSVSPVREEGGKELRSKSSGLVMAEQSVLTLDAIGAGTLDPIVGRFTVDTKSVRFEHLYSVAVWRTISAMQWVSFLLVSLPMALISLFFSGLALVKGEPGALICSLPMLAVAGFHINSVFGSRTTRLRVIGFKDRTLDLSLTGRLKTQREFVETFFRRAGLAPVEFP